MEKGDADWTRLAFAFYSLAHDDPSDFNALEPRLQNTEVGRLCAEYIRTGDNQLLDQAGYLLTGTHSWHIYLGRSM